jgi:hypothetical protein
MLVVIPFHDGQVYVWGNVPGMGTYRAPSLLSRDESFGGEAARLVAAGEYFTAIATRSTIFAWCALGFRV